MIAAAVTATALLAVITVFQIALAAGTPWGAAAWGGKYEGVLPRKLRIASAFVGVVVYPLLAVAILEAGGVIASRVFAADSAIRMWVLTGFFGVGALANLASPSRIEKIWAPVGAALAVCCAVIARA